MSGRRQQARDIAVDALANPEAFYKGALAVRRMVSKLDDTWGSADACVAAKVREAEKMPGLRIVRVAITDHGRAVLKRRLSPAPAGELTIQSL